MKQEDINALRSLARNCVAEVHAAWKIGSAKTQKEKDAISKPILLRYEKKIIPKFTIVHLNYYIGIHTGVLKEKL